MKKILSLIVVCCFAIMGYAQKPLSFSTVIYEDSVDAQSLYNLTKNWMAHTFEGFNNFLEQSGKEITGKGKLTFPTTLLYSSIKGHIEYSLNVQFKDGRLKLTMGSFTHIPELVAYFNNDMGVLVDSLPEKLDDIGIKGANRKGCYKYYFKHGVPLCKTEFDKLAADLKLFLNNRISNKETW